MTTLFKLRRLLSALLFMLLFALLFSSSCLFAQAPERVVYGRVWFSDTFSLYDAEDAGVEIEHSVLKRDVYVEAHFNATTLADLQKRGVRVDVIVSDVQAQNRERIAKSKIFLHDFSQDKRRGGSIAAPRNFKLGSMGGFYTLDELDAEFARMKTQFPDLITTPETIGSSIESRPIYAYRVGTASALAQRKPEILYTAVHHAREPGSASNLVYLLWDLFERFAANDPEAQYLLNNRQLYVVPMTNPDGYAYNQINNPEGGGMWRKNRRRNSNGTVGVDLNRNYGTQEYWSSPNNGSSTSPSSDTYRGTAPFSEPETQAIRDFCNRHAFKTAINYHTYSNLLIYPYSYTERETPDSTYFRAICAEITKVNRYSGGRDLQTVGYSVRGASDDWMYGESDGHGKIMTMTPEVGTVTDTFWPSADRIIPQGVENLSTNLQTAWSAETNLRPVQTFLTESQQTGRTRINIEVQNLGIVQAREEATLRITPLVKGVDIALPQRALKKLRSTEFQREIFDVQADSTVANGARIPVEILITQEGVPRRDTVQMQIFQPDRIDLFSGDASKWELGRWGVVADRELGKSVLTDSPSGLYRIRDANYVRYGSSISLRGVRSATLEFRTKWSIEANYDFAVAQASVDNGVTWKSLQSSLMKPGQGGAQPTDGFGFDGNFPQWIRQECSLDEFVGKDIMLRFGVLSDANGGQFDGWYLSDIALRTYKDSVAARQTMLTVVNDLRVLPNVVLGERELQIIVPTAMLQSVPQQTLTVTIFNMLGQRVFTDAVTIQDGIGAFRNPSLPRGVYLVIVSNNTVGGGTLSSKQTILVGEK